MAKRNVHVIYVGDAGDNITVDEFWLANACLLMSLESILIDLTLRDMLQSPVYQRNLVVVAVDEAHW